MKAEWNTGRLYTTEGQVIRAETQPDGTILFWDRSRSVGGRIAQPNVQIFNERDLRDYVMTAYDQNDYTTDSESWAFGMMRTDA